MRQFIISKAISCAIYPNTFYEDITWRDSTGGRVGVNKVYLLNTDAGTKSTLSPKDLTKVFNFGIETTRRTI